MFKGELLEVKKKLIHLRWMEVLAKASGKAERTDKCFVYSNIYICLLTSVNFFLTSNNSPFYIFSFIYDTIFLFSAEAWKVFLDKVGDVSMLAKYIGLSHAYIYVGALGEEFCRACSIVEDEERHDNLASHII